MKRKVKINKRLKENLAALKRRLQSSSKHHLKDVAGRSHSRVREIQKKRTDDKVIPSGPVIVPKVTSSEGILEKYKIEVDKASVEIKIVREASGILYQLSLPEVQAPTLALLDEIRKEMLTEVAFNVGEALDKGSINVLKGRFVETARKLIEEKLPHVKSEAEEFLIGHLLQEMLGLGKVEFLINDPLLEEIVINSIKEPIRVYHKKYGWLVTNLKMRTEDEINNYANIIARRVGRQISVLTPLLDAHLVTGDRANAVLYPISTKGNTITIRKFARDPWTIIDLINNKTCNIDVAALIWLAIEYEMNVIFSGGTGSGKTSFLNACMPFIPPNHQVISIEDTSELVLPEFLYWRPLITRTPNAEGKGEVSMLDLLVNSLRMRPDRIVLGEMRRQKEAEVLFEAMHTGHSVYSTVHADTAAETIQRLTNPPISIPPNLLKAVNLNVVMFRDRRRGIRRVYQVAEFVLGKDEVNANILHRWIPEKDEIAEHAESVRFFEDLSRHTGMEEKELARDLERKKSILQWLIKHNIRSLYEMGKVFSLYYMNEKMLTDALKRNDPQSILK